MAASGEEIMTDGEFFRLRDRIQVLREQFQIERERRMRKDGWRLVETKYQPFRKPGAPPRMAWVDPETNKAYTIHGDAFTLWLARKAPKVAARKRP